jgi:hypothetical protein
MGALSEFREPMLFSSSVMFTGTTILPDDCITTAGKVSAGVLTADRMRDVRGRISQELFGPTAAVTALTKWLHIVRGGTGARVAFEAAIALGPTGADRTITVDLQKSTGGAAFATVLSATIGFVDASVERVATAATISSTALTDGDILQVVVTVAGAAGNQATGLTVTLTYDEYNT